MEITVAHRALIGPICQTLMGERVMRLLRRTIQVLAMAPIELQESLVSQLNLSRIAVTFIQQVDELRALVREGRAYDVALLPADTCDTNWWQLWGELNLLAKRPAILVYAQRCDFELWSSVIESGGYDIVSLPLERRILVRAIVQAASTSAWRAAVDLGPPPP